jgi:hypothetical protein
VGPYTITLAVRTERLRQDLARPFSRPSDMLMLEARELRAHVEIRLTATLTAPGGAQVDLTARDECRRLARRLRLAVVRPT